MVGRYVRENNSPKICTRSWSPGRNRPRSSLAVPTACTRVRCDRAVFYARPSFPSRLTTSRLFLLYLTLAVYPPFGMRPMVSGFRNRLRSTLLHADAMVISSKKTSMLPICMHSRLNTRHACLRPVTSS